MKRTQGKVVEESQERKKELSTVDFLKSFKRIFYECEKEKKKSKETKNKLLWHHYVM